MNNFRDVKRVGAAVIMNAGVFGSFGKVITMVRRIFLLFAALIALSACAAPTTSSISSEAGTVLEPPAPIVDFSLPSSLGRPYGLADMRGKPALIFFGYTFCPDVCPTTLADFRRIKADLGAKADSVNFIFISVDPERDTPEVLARHISAFDPAFIGLQGDEATLKKIGTTFGLYYQKNAPRDDGSYLVDHSSAVYLADSDGQIRVVYSYGTAYEAIAKDVTKFIP